MDELARLKVYLDELAVEWMLTERLVSSLNLVLEEALANINFYAFDDDLQHTIEIDFSKTGSYLSILIIDDGHEYDPTLASDPDITLPAEERSIGGLGIFLIKKIMDKVEYQRKENKNHLMLIKNIES